MASCNVNSDMLFEILSRVELKTLRSCRLVSRECNRLTYESSFMRLHCHRTNTIAGYFLQSLKRNRHHSTFLSIHNPGLDPELSLDFLPDRPVKILATVDQGLMLCMSQLENPYYICKPSTRQWEIIPSPNTQCFTAKIAMTVLTSDPLRFKVVRLSDGEYADSELELHVYNKKRYHCEIFDSEFWMWKQLDDLMLSYDEFFKSKHAISACGGLYWLTCTGDKNNILSFREDKWELVSLPDPLCDRDQWHSVDLAKYEGKPALICMKPDIDFVELWIMKNCSAERVWSRQHTINLTGFNKEITHSSPDSVYNADTLLMIGVYNATFYNFKNGQFHRLNFESKHSHPESAFFFQTDLEPVQLRQPPTSLLDYCYSTSFIVFWLFVFVLICFIRDM